MLYLSNARARLLDPAPTPVLSTFHIRLVNTPPLSRQSRTHARLLNPVSPSDSLTLR